MNKQDKSPRLPSVRTDESNRSQNIFIAVGLAIVVGGLWMLYDTDGPYHPDIPVTDTVINSTSGS
jgi:hypothetical protein